VPTPTAHADARLLADLAERFDRELATALGGAREVALVNFPNHGNPGDSAIWLGARAALRRLGVRVRYRCAWSNYHPDALAAALPDGPVLINGGGNFGDLYKGQQQLRERLLTELRGRRLIQLPQSVHFAEQRNLDRNRRLVAEHGNVLLMLREARSYEFASEQFEAETLLAPDCALALQALPRPEIAPDVDLLWLHRLPGDPEYVGRDPLSTARTVREIEWLRKVPPEPTWSNKARLARRANGWLAPRSRKDPRWARYAWRPFAATFDPMGMGHVERGLEILARGRVLLTDKLHGHVMALLSGLPHVVLDNSYGKVSGTYRSWTHPSTITRWAEDGAGAVALAEELLAGASR
jgi:exopolysaccharide biosynthesis predicted pyruvyltransferase EpsI